MLIEAVAIDDPVVYCEHKYLYYHLKADKLPTEGLPTGKARIAREGRDLTIVTYSAMLHEALAVAGVSLADLPFPEGASVAMIVRGQDVVPPKGTTVITPGDHIYVFVRPEDRSLSERCITWWLLIWAMGNMHLMVGADPHSFK